MNSHVPGAARLHGSRWKKGTRRPGLAVGMSALVLFAGVAIAVPHELRLTHLDVSDAASKRPLELQERLLQEARFAEGVAGRAALIVSAVWGIVAVALGIFLAGNPLRALAKTERAGAGTSDRAARDDVALEMSAMERQLAVTREQAEREAAQHIATLEQLRHADRLSTLGKLASAIGHELGTPLAIVTGRAELIVDAHPPGDAAHDNASIILDQARKMTSIIRQFLDFARRRHAQRAQHDIRQLLEQTLGLLGTLVERRGLVLELEGSGSVEWELDAFQIQQAVTNLVVNGIQATPDGGRLVVGYELRADPRTDTGDAIFLRLYVRDQGAGMPPEVRERAFEPFFTTKGVGEGTGLGLSIAQGIVRDHDGWIDVESEVGNGSLFSIWLPKGEVT